MTYHQLTEHERYLISQLRKAGHRVADIARILQCHRSTIYREYQRNSTRVGACLTYCPSKAQERRNGRLRRSRRGPCHEAWQYARVESLLRRQWSPEQIANTLRKRDGSGSASRASTATCGGTGAPAGRCIWNCGAATNGASATTAWTAAAACRASA